MKRTLLTFSSLALLASCSTWDDLISRDLADPALPGVPTQINCNPEPTLIYSKAGDLIDRVFPVLHPSCDGQVLGETVELDAPWWSIFGPPSRQATTFPMEATDDDYDDTPITVAANTPEEATTPTTPSDPSTQPDTPTPAVEPDTPSEPEPQPEPEPEPDTGCNGASHCEPDSATQKEEYERWREDVRRNEGN